MKKIIYLILPILLFTLFKTNVYAEENNLYFTSNYGRFQFTSFNNTTYDGDLNFKAYDIDFKLSYYVLGNNKKVNYILYDKVNELYLIILDQYTYSLCSDTILDYNILNGQAQCKNDDNIWISASTANSYYTILSDKSESDYFSLISNGLTPQESNNDSFYLIQNNSHRSWLDNFKYIYNHSSDFELVTITNGYKLFINGNEVPLKESSSVEPTPEDPNNGEYKEIGGTVIDYLSDTTTNIINNRYFKYLLSTCVVTILVTLIRKIIWRM